MSAICANAEQSALEHYRHPVGGLLDLAQDVRTHEHGVASGQRTDQLPHFDDLARIKAVAWLVEDEDVRIVDQGLGKRRPLAIAARQCSRRLVDTAPNASRSTTRSTAASTSPLGHSAQPCHECKEFADAHLPIERR